jgi:hypothetical protein
MTEDEPGVPKQEISKAIREETSRGRRGPASLSARRRDAELRREFSKLLERGTKHDFDQAMVDFGVTLGSEKYRKALEIWRANRRS